MAETTVDEWLRNLCSKAKSPTGKVVNESLSYERTKTTNEILNELKQTNHSTNVQVQEEIKMANILKEEYIAEGARLATVLKPLGLDPSSLSNDLWAFAKMMSESLSNAKNLEPDVIDQMKESTDLRKKQMLALQKLQNLEKVWESLNDLSVAEVQEQVGKKKEAEFLSKKVNEYAANIRHFEKRLEAVGFQPDIRHGALAKQAEHLKVLQEKLAQSSTKLSAYSDLTPDINLARVQVQQLKAELEEMENQITNNISSINAK